MDRHSTEPTESNPGQPSAPGRMAQPESARLEDDELLNLYQDDSSHGASYLVRRNLYDALDAAGMTDAELVEVVLDDEDPEQPALVLLPIDEDEQDADLAQNPRRIAYSEGQGAEVRVPPDLLGGGDNTEARLVDLGLDLDDYSNDNQLLFEPVIGDGILMLLPTRWESGDPYVPPGVDEPDRGPNPERTVSGMALSERTIASTAQSQGVDVDALEDVLRDVQAAAEETEWTPPVQYQPIDVGDATVHVVDPGVWDRVREKVREQTGGAPFEFLEAAEIAHLSEARGAIQSVGASEYRHFDSEFSAIVVR